MSFEFKDFDKLDLYSKTSIISIVVLMPFWYASIYLFGNHFFINSDLLLKIVFSFCFSISWYFINVLLFVFEQSIKVDISDNLVNLFKGAGMISVYYLCFVIVIAYSLNIHSYVSFLKTAYYFLIIPYITTIIVELIYKYRQKRKI